MRVDGGIVSNPEESRSDGCGDYCSEEKRHQAECYRRVMVSCRIHCVYDRSSEFMFRSIDSNLNDLNGLCKADARGAT